MVSATDKIIPAKIKNTPAVTALRVVVVDPLLFVGFAEVIREKILKHTFIWFTNNILIVCNTAGLTLRAVRVSCTAGGT